MRLGDRGSIPGRDRPMSFKQVVTDPLSSAQQQVRVSWVLGDGHFKRMTRVTVGVSRLRSLISSRVLSLGQNP